MPGEHLIALGPEGATMWRAFVLRAPGFPAAWATELGSDKAQAAAEAWRSTTQVAAARVRELKVKILELERQASGERKKELRRFGNRIHRGSIGDRLGRLDGPLREQLEPLVDPVIRASREAKDARLAFEGVLAREHARLVAKLQQTVRRGRLREAIAWESVSALARIDMFLECAPDQLNWKNRDRCHRALGYLQRLCLKNDTIGFYGPVAWCELSDDVETIEFEAHAPLVLRHEYYFEPWALNNLARPLGDDPRTKTYLPVRRLPSIGIRDGSIKLPLQPPQERSPTEVKALQLSDGSLDSHGVAREIARQGLASADDAMQLLDALEREGLLVRSPELPTTYRAELTLQEWLARMPAELAAPHRARLDRILEARARVAQACGDASAVSEAIVRLQKTFESETGTPGKRGGGQFFEARSALFHESERNVRLRLGPRFLRDLADPFRVLQHIIRWYVQSVAKALEERVADLMVKAGVNRMEFLSVVFEVLGDIPGIVETKARELRGRWSEAINPLVTAGQLDVAAAGAAVEKAFPEMPTYWELGRRSSPDLFIAASDVAAIERGDYYAVLGEIHVAANTLLESLFTWARDESVLCAWTNQDAARPSLVLDLYEAVTTVRLARQHDAYRYQWVIPHARNAKWTNESVVPLGTLYVEHDADGEVRGRCGLSGRTWRIPDMFNPALNFATMSAFGLAEEKPHNGRLQMGRLLLVREQWVFEKSSLAFAMRDDAADCFGELTAWAREHGIPRHIFVRIKTEMKPYYFDLSSPLYAELFAKVVRSLPEDDTPVKVSEMIPTPDELWLTDAEGQRYSGELRLVLLEGDTASDVDRS